MFPIVPAISVRSSYEDSNTIATKLVEMQGLERVKIIILCSIASVLFTTPY